MVAGYRARRLQAVASANELLAEVSIDQTRQIDVFGLCEQLGLWLVFFPLDRLLGAFIREGVGGVMITTERPVTVQRYTAAHELGHWRLGHETTHTFDGEAQILGSTSDDEAEHLAQVFAAALLMPPPLVLGTLERLGIADDVSAVDAYTVAREAGVSYEAAVRQLGNLGIVNRDRLTDLLGITPLDIKTIIGRGQRPITGHADVWPVDEDWHGHELDVRIDDEVIISLPENRSTGHRWVLKGHETQRPRTPEPPPLHGAEASVPSDSLMRQRSVLDRITTLGQRTTGMTSPVPDVTSDYPAKPLLPRPSTDLGSGATLVGDRYFTPRSSVVSNHASDGGPPTLFTESSISRMALPENPAPPPVIGASGLRVLAVQFHLPGAVVLSLIYQSSYSKADPARHCSISAFVEPRRLGFSAEQLTTNDYADSEPPPEQHHSEHDIPSALTHPFER